MVLASGSPRKAAGPVAETLTPRRISACAAPARTPRAAKVASAVVVLDIMVTPPKLVSVESRVPGPRSGGQAALGQRIITRRKRGATKAASVRLALPAGFAPVTWKSEKAADWFT